MLDIPGHTPCLRSFVIQLMIRYIMCSNVLCIKAFSSPCGSLWDTHSKFRPFPSLSSFYFPLIHFISAVCSHKVGQEYVDNLGLLSLCCACVLPQTAVWLSQQPLQLKASRTIGPCSLPAIEIITYQNYNLYWWYHWVWSLSNSLNHASLSLWWLQCFQSSQLAKSSALAGGKIRDWSSPRWESHRLSIFYPVLSSFISIPKLLYASGWLPQY